MTCKIYAIKCDTTPNIYIGSTKLTLNDRFTNHKSQYKKHINGEFPFVSSFEILKYPNAYIELLEQLETDDKLQMRIKENEYINRHINNITNKNKAYLSPEDKRIQIKSYNDARNFNFMQCDTCHKLIKRRNKKYHFETHNKI